jgi:hypothetical protein
MPEYTHDRFGKCELAEITQKQSVEYAKLMNKNPDMSMFEYRGESVKAAIKLGLLIDPVLTEDDVDNANPGYIRWLSDKCIADMIAEANSIDPLS